MTNILSHNDTSLAEGGTPLAHHRPHPVGLHPLNSIVAPLRTLALSPWTWVGLFTVVAVISLLLPIRLPIGGYYWDVTLYPDAAWRIANGQIPHVDFFAPVGALEYYSFALLQAFFSTGHLLLLADWCILLAAMPLFVMVIRQIPPQDVLQRLGLLLPFLLFSLMPLNTTNVYPLAGVDGFGIYNRHISQLMYVLAATIFFVRQARMQAIVLAGLLLALFFTKITGFVIGFGLIVHGLLAGRINLRAFLFAAAFTLTTAGMLEAVTGIVSAYMADVRVLLDLNKTSLFSRLRSPLTLHLDILLPALVLAALLLWHSRATVLDMLASKGLRDGWTRVRRVIDLDGVWLISIALAAVVFESQNSGSQEFVFLWPLFLYVLHRAWPPNNRLRFVVVALVLLASVPTAHAYVFRALRVTGVSLAYQPLNIVSIGKLGQVVGKPELVARAFEMNKHYAATRAAYERLAAHNLDSSHLLYSEIDFHLAWMISSGQAIDAIRNYEKKHRVRLKSLMTMDFVDPVTFNMQRQPVRLVSIGMMAGRTIPPLDDRRAAAAAKADAFLAPRCPVTPTRAYLVKYFEPLLRDRVRIALTPCWDMYLRQELARGSASENKP